jgi:hypothetical protein
MQMLKYECISIVFLILRILHLSLNSIYAYQDTRNLRMSEFLLTFIAIAVPALIGFVISFLSGGSNINLESVNHGIRSK